MTPSLVVISVGLPSQERLLSAITAVVVGGVSETSIFPLPMIIVFIFLGIEHAFI